MYILPLINFLVSYNYLVPTYIISIVPIGSNLKISRLSYSYTKLFSKINNGNESLLSIGTEMNHRDVFGDHLYVFSRIDKSLNYVDANKFQHSLVQFF